MRQCIALAGIVCLLATGCAGSGVLGGKGCTPCHVATSQNAPRPTLFRGACRPCSCETGCDVDCGCEVGCGCEDDYCSCEPGCGCDDGGSCSSCDSKRSGRKRLGAMDGRCMCTVQGIASGFCPHRGGYPEYPAYNAGTPTGQVAYPYYTVRGPRDFLMCNPPSIGPY